MTIDIIHLGEQFDLTRTFTAVAGVTTLSTVTATVTMLAPDGDLIDVPLDPVDIDNVAQPPTATFTGTFTPPAETSKFGLWVEEWKTDDDLVDVTLVYWYAPRNPVLVAQEAAGP